MCPRLLIFWFSIFICQINLLSYLNFFILNPSHQQQNPIAKFVGQGVFSSVVLAGSMQYASIDIRQWRVVAVVRFFISLQGGRTIWPWCTSRRRRMGDVAEQLVGNAKATFSFDVANIQTQKMEKESTTN